MAGTDKEATVKARLDGVDEVARDFGRIKSAAADASSGVGKGWRDAGGAVRDAVQGVLNDVAHVVTAAASINFAASVSQVHQLEAATDRMGVASKRSIESVKDSVNQLSTKINELPNQTQAWVASVGKLTYNYEGAATAAEGAAQYAALIGDTVQDVAPLVVTLEELSGNAGKSGDLLKVMVQQAKELGTVGGPRAVGEAVEHLRGQLSQLTGDAKQYTALVAGFGGKGQFTPQQRERALGAVMSRVESNPEGFERFLGHKITDEFGHVKDITGVMKELADYARKGRGQRLRSEFTFGKEATAGLLYTDFEAVRRAESAGRASDAEHALNRLIETPSGQRRANEIKKAQAMQEVVGNGSAIGDASDWLGKLAGDHPILAGLGASLGASLVAKGAGAGMGALGKLVTGGKAAVEAGAAASAPAAEGVAGGGLATGLGLSGLATIGTLAAGVLATGKTLMDLGEASAAKQGFDNTKALGYKQADALSAKAALAAREAESHMSPGMREALQAEQAMRASVPQAARASAHQGQASATQVAASDPKVAALVQELVKAGATTTLALETASKLIAEQQRPVQIEIVDSTGGGVDARVRGEQ